MLTQEGPGPQLSKWEVRDLRTSMGGCSGKGGTAVRGCEYVLISYGSFLT